MNAITAQEALPIETLQEVLATGNISNLTPKQKLEYYVRTCESLGLNPLTRPFRFLKLNNQEQLYATRDCTDQLRQLRGINLQIVEKKIEAGVLIVTARAQTKDGRHDEDIGAVMLPQSGESRANAVMKAITKAKRRVTLSICGLGMSDESELDTIPGAYTFDPSDPAPTIDGDAPSPAPQDARDAINASIPLQNPLQQHHQRAAAAATPRPPRRSEAPPAEPATGRNAMVRDEIIAAYAAVTTRQEYLLLTDKYLTRQNWFRENKPEIAEEITKAMSKAWERTDEPTVDDDPELPELEIHGEEKLGAG